MRPAARIFLLLWLFLSQAWSVQRAPSTPEPRLREIPRLYPVPTANPTATARPPVTEPTRRPVGLQGNRGPTPTPTINWLSWLTTGGGIATLTGFIVAITGLIAILRKRRPKND
jgi:hypothetical protein